MQTAPALHRAVALALGLSSTKPCRDHNRGRGGGIRCGRIPRLARGLRHRDTEGGLDLPTSRAGGAQIRRWTLWLEAHDRIGCSKAH